MKNQKKIDRRLLNQMLKAEQDAFDKELAGNSDLAESFELNQDIADFFARENPDLEDRLDVLGDEYFAENALSPKRIRSNRLWFWLTPLLLLIACGLFYLLSGTSRTETISPNTINTDINSSPTPSETNQEEVKTNISSPENIQENRIPSKNKDKKTENAIKKKEKPDFYPPTSQKEIESIAALDPKDFATNPMLEGLMRENVRDETTATIEIPANEAILKTAMKTFRLKGSTNAKPSYQLSIFSNSTFAFDNDYPIFRREVKGSPTGDDFVFDFTVNTTFPPGLYYLILQNEKSELLSISKFMVQ